MAETAAEKMEKAAVKMMVKQPFFGSLLCSLKRVEDKNIPTMGVNEDILAYNPTFVEALDSRYIVPVLIHEMLHIAFAHLATQRGHGRDQHTWNVSADVVTNNIIKQDLNMQLPNGCIDEPAYHGKSVEQVYRDKIKSCKRLKMKVNGVDGTSNGTDPDDQETFDTHGKMSKTTKEKVFSSVAQAQALARQAGKMPAGLDRTIDKLLKSKIAWENILRNIATQKLSRKDYSFIRPRRSMIGQGIVLPSIISESNPQLVIGVDTSGSIASSELDKFAAEIEKLSWLTAEVTVMTCDHEVHTIQMKDLYNTGKKLKFKGGGGTSFVPVFDEVKKRGIKPDLLVYLTDGYGSYPKKQPGFPVIWVMTTDYDPPWGQTVRMRDQDGERYR